MDFTQNSEKLPLKANTLFKIEYKGIKLRKSILQNPHFQKKLENSK